jgi:lipopolysaccharide transport system ATP-binding protein
MQDVSRGEGRTVLFVSHNMAAVRSLCQRGIVLENGGMAFDGEVNEAVDFYINGAETEEDRQILDHIIYKKDFLRIDRILLNGTTADRTTMTPKQDHLQIVIRGNTSEEMTGNVRLIIKKLDGTPLAALNEALYSGRTITIAKGPFEIHKQIRLPKYMADGEYLVDLLLYRPSVMDYLKVRNALRMRIEGFYDPYARPLDLKVDGFIGLESEEL